MRGDISFYVFPAKPYEQERRQRWIQAVRRAGEDGQVWEPGPNSRVCSQHFVGNKMSNIMHHPAYVPTIFPSEYYRQAPADSTASGERFDRWAERHRRSADSSMNAFQSLQPATNANTQPENDEGQDVCSQSHCGVDSHDNASLFPFIGIQITLCSISLSA
ncbi:uncharacterized protein LOC119398585 [Rhipicephalus sanguineus]|uniref:uncharacterized protein LOC119398585 n=1 Tax=Rhipicephalus sanguineus TaxID=34632 RepID=UPI0020C367D6|nr:uncharacterized protein LOC119398585 [Rhipicephalus sanguineus]